MIAARFRFPAAATAAALAALLAPPAAAGVAWPEGGLARPEDRARVAWAHFIDAHRAVPGPPGLVVWQTWASAGDVFGGTGAALPTWEEAGAAQEFEGEGVKVRLVAGLAERFGGARGAARRAPDPNARTQTMYDRTAFEWIGLRQLHCVESQRKLWAWRHDYESRRSPDDLALVEFNPGSTLLKAVWRPIAEADAGRYFAQGIDGRLYGLVALHLAVKVLPTWLWATWEHVDNPGRPAVAARDPFGRRLGELSPALARMFADAGLDAKLWDHYRLNGTQIAFTEGDGRPTLLGNSVIEGGFATRSSCMTCHARSAAGEAGYLGVALDAGTPDPDWFLTASRPAALAYLPLDFVWSLTRARRCFLGSEPASAPSPSQDAASGSGGGAGSGGR